MIERIHMKRSYETAASFFEKHSAFPLVSVIRRLYYCVFLRDSQRKVKYLRACGAKIGNGVNLRDLACLGSEPYLVEIGDNTSFSSNVRVVTMMAEPPGCTIWALLLKNVIILGA